MIKTAMTLAVVCVGVGLTVAGCGGGGARSETAISNTTVSKGQALIDLKRAHEAGALSNSEYERQRRKLLDE